MKQTKNIIGYRCMDKLVKTKKGTWQVEKGKTRQDVAQPTLMYASVKQPIQAKPQNLESFLSGVTLPETPAKLRQRLRDTINLYQKGVRGKLDTYGQLTRPIDEGGIGLSEKVADEIIDKVVSKMAIKTEGEKVPLGKQEENRAIKFSQKLKEVHTVREESTSDYTSSPASVSVKPSRLVTDVKSYPKVVGPIEELRILTLKDFRRFDSNTDKALKIIEQKLQLLKDDSYEDYVKGVNAWRQSPMYQQYIKLVEESLHSGRQLSETVATSRQKDLESLSWNEFVALRNFNSIL
jgi:hypothetical protein